MPISNWDFKGSSWLRPSDHGFCMVAADINDIKQKTIDRLKALHPEVWQERPRMEQYHARDEDGEYRYDENGDYLYENRPEEREEYNAETGQYIMVPTGRMEQHPVGPAFDAIVGNLPPEAHKLYEWILRELKKERMPHTNYSNVAMPAEISEEFTKTIPVIEEAEEEEEDELADADGGGARNNIFDPIERQRIRENQYGERVVHIEMSLAMVIRELQQFWNHLIWLDEYNKPMPQYRSKQFTFPVMLRWNQLFKYYMDSTKTSQYEKPNVVFTCSNRWTITERTTAQDLIIEGEIMGHCVGQYAGIVAGNECRIFSLADKKGYPHVTIETRADRQGDGQFDPNFKGLNWPGFVRQVYGKSNVQPIDAYAALVKEWIDSIDHHVDWVGIQRTAGPALRIENLATLHDAATRIRSGEEFPINTEVTETGPDRYGLYRSAQVGAVNITIFPDNLWATFNNAMQRSTGNPYQDESANVNAQQMILGVLEDLRVVMALQARVYAANPGTTSLTSVQNLREYIHYHVSGDLRDSLVQLFDQQMVGDPATWETYVQPTLFDHEGSWHFPQSRWLAKSSGGFFTYAADVPALAQQAMDRLLQRPDILKLDEQTTPAPPAGVEDQYRPEVSGRQVGILLQEIRDQHPEAYKLMPWAVRELKRIVPMGQYNIMHMVDIVGQLGRLLNEMRQQNQLPAGFDINQLNFEQAEAWLYEQRAVDEDSQWENAEHVYTFADKWSVDRVTTQNDLALEGQLMGHCVGGYHGSVASGRCLIYSLRDPKGEPHATLEFEGNGNDSSPNDGSDSGQAWIITQIQGKQNQMPIEEYVARIREWFGNLQQHGVKLQFGQEETYEFHVDSPEAVVRFADQYSDNGLYVPHDEITDANGWNRSYNPDEWGIHEGDPPQYVVQCSSPETLGAEAVKELLQEGGRGYYHEESFTNKDVDAFAIGLDFLEDCGFYDRKSATQSHPQRVFELADEEFMEAFTNYESGNWEYMDHMIFEEWKDEVWPHLEERGGHPSDAFREWCDDNEQAYDALQEKASTALWESYMYETGPKAAHDLVEKLKLWAEKPTEHQLRLTVRRAFLRDGLLYGSNWIMNEGRVVR